VTSASRKSLEVKTQLPDKYEAILGDATAVVCGDQVTHGSPAPDLFLECCKQMGVPPSETLVFEHSISGIKAAEEAGCYCVAVPSMPKAAWDGYRAAGAKDMYGSLLYVQPERYGLPPLRDAATEPDGQGRMGTPLSPPLHVRAEVVHGFGRGAKELGWPTANLKESDLPPCLGLNYVGIWFGLARIEEDGSRIYPAALSIGFNPTFDDVKCLTVEPHLVGYTGPDFYGKILRLSVLGLIRDEQRFSSLEALIEAIRLDVDFSTRAVDALSSGESGYRDVWVEGSLEHETPSST